MAPSHRDNGCVSEQTPPRRDLAAHLFIDLTDQSRLWELSEIRSNWWTNDLGVPHQVYGLEDTKSILLTWFDKGWVDLIAYLHPADSDELSKADWAGRAKPSPGYLTLTRTDARRLLEAAENWGDKESSQWMVQLDFSEEGRQQDTSTWMRLAGVSTDSMVSEADATQARVLAGILEIATRFTYKSYLPEGYRPDHAVRDLVSIFQRDLDDGLKYWIAQDEWKVVGFAHAAVASISDPRELELRSIYVEPSSLGSNAAQILLDASTAGVGCFLWVPTVNARAQAFFRRNGFQLDGVSKLHEERPNFELSRMVR